MNLLNLFRMPDINAGVKEYQETKGAALVDVRTREEYRQGHIPGSVNVPLQQLSLAEKKLKDKNQPLYVYCLSGSRARQAVGMLKGMGYASVKNIGGVSGYQGKLVR